MNRAGVSASGLSCFSGFSEEAGFWPLTFIVRLLERGSSPRQRGVNVRDASVLMLVDRQRSVIDQEPARPDNSAAVGELDTIGTKGILSITNHSACRFCLLRRPTDGRSPAAACHP